MRQITAKYGGECRECGAEIERGSTVYYEKRIGLFCVGCQPGEHSDRLRELRQESIDARNERLHDRAHKRLAKADQLRQRDAHLWQDHAFATQPGRIPARDRAIQRRDKAHELAAEAEQIERKATPRKARVKGDAAARDEQRRQAVREWIEPGMRVRHRLLGTAEVVKVNRKTARVRLDTDSEYAEDLIFIERA